MELNDVAEKSGFRVIAAVGAVAEHSIMHQYAAGRPDQLDTGELESFAEKIFEKLSTAEDAAAALVLKKACSERKSNELYI